MMASQGEVDENREFVCSQRATEMHAGHGTTEGRACMRGALQIRVMGKSIRGRACSKVAGQGVIDT